MGLPSRGNLPGVGKAEEGIRETEAGIKGKGAAGTEPGNLKQELPFASFIIT